MGYLDNELARIESAIDGEDMRDAIVDMITKTEHLLNNDLAYNFETNQSQDRLYLVNKNGDVISDKIGISVSTDPVSQELVANFFKGDQYTYSFNGWTGADDSSTGQINTVTYSTDVIVDWTQTVKSYPITFYNKDGVTVLQTKSVAYGDIPTYTGQTPTTTDTAPLTLFKKWNPDLAIVTGPASYTATYYSITEVLLTNGKSFNISVPNGNSDPLVYHFSVDSNGNTTIT